MKIMKLMTQQRWLFGVLVKITTADERGEEWQASVVKKCFQLMETVQRMMSYHDPASDIARLNRCGHVAPLAVHPWTHQVLKNSARRPTEPSM
jgi:FAD:protein FMN transferase